MRCFFKKKSRLCRANSCASSARANEEIDRHAYDNVDFYKKSFAEAGGQPDLTCLEDLKFRSSSSKICATPTRSACSPFRKKTSPASTHPPAPPARRRSWGIPQMTLRTGATASPAASMWGGTADLTVQVSLRLWPVYGAVSARVWRGGGRLPGHPDLFGQHEAPIQMMVDLGTDILCCTPSYALYLADTLSTWAMILKDFQALRRHLRRRACLREYATGNPRQARHPLLR